MLEKVDAGIDVLLEDLTVGYVSAWQQWAAASSTKTSDNGGYYARVDMANTAKPISMAKHSAQLAQVFRFVRRGAVRVGASSGSTSVVPVAFVNSNGRYVLVLRARSASGTLTIRGLPAGNYAQRFVSDERRTQESTPLAVSGAGVQVTIPEAGVLTIYGVP
jgi:hypothetical protein